MPNQQALTRCAYMLTAAAFALASAGTHAANTPCSGKKGGISHCVGRYFVCKDGSTSQSKKDCRTYTLGIDTRSMPL